MNNAAIIFGSSEKLEGKEIGSIKVNKIYKNLIHIVDHEIFEQMKIKLLCASCFLFLKLQFKL